MAQDIAGTWSTASSAGFNPRYWFTSSIVDGKIYCIGGTDGVGLNSTVDVYDPQSDTWTTLATTGHFTPRMALTSCVYQNKIYVMGGSEGSESPANICNVLEVFDPATNTWTTPQTTGTFTPRCVLASAVVNDKIYVIGGFSGTNDLAILQVFDPSTNTWSAPQTTGTFSPRGAFPAIVYQNKIYVIGGAQNGTIPTFIEVFDPATNAWSTLSTKGTFAGRCDHAAGVIGDKVYIMGGLYGGGFVPIATDAFQEFDLSTNTWTTPNFDGSFTSRGYVSSAVVGNTFYVLGGVDTIGGQPYCLSTNEVFDPSTAVVTLDVEQSTMPIAAPDPVRSELRLTNLQARDEISVENILGRTVVPQFEPSGTETSINLANLLPGTYFVRIANPSRTTLKKIVKY